MKCERCGRNEATFYYQSNINGRVTQVHLCPDCAAELGYTSRLDQSFRPFRRSFFDPFSLLEDFGMLSNRMTEFPAPLEEAARAAAGIPEDTDTPAGLVGRDEAGPSPEGAGAQRAGDPAEERRGQRELRGSGPSA